MPSLSFTFPEQGYVPTPKEQLVVKEEPGIVKEQSSRSKEESQQKEEKREEVSRRRQLRGQWFVRFQF